MNITVVPAHEVLTAAMASEAGLLVEDLRGVVVVQVDGDIDLHTGPGLRRVLVDLLPPPGQDSPQQLVTSDLDAGAGRQGVRAVVVDLTEVEFMDSYALGVLVHGHRLARPGGRAFALVATSSMFHTLFQVTGLAQVLPLHPDVATAVASLRLASWSNSPQESER